MLKIEKGKPWVMWPNLLVANFIDEPANKIFDHNGDFEVILNFKLPSDIKSKSTLFSKLPSYFGIDIEENGLLLILTEETNITEYKKCEYTWEINKEYELKINKTNNFIDVYVNDLKYITYVIKTSLAKDDLSHIIFGAGNFPKNGFNLNYLSLELNYLMIKKDGLTICEHLFDTFVHNKSYDKTGNCNFIHSV